MKISKTSVKGLITRFVRVRVVKATVVDLHYNGSKYYSEDYGSLIKITILLENQSSVVIPIKYGNKRYRIGDVLKVKQYIVLGHEFYREE